MRGQRSLNPLFIASEGGFLQSHSIFIQVVLFRSQYMTVPLVPHTSTRLSRSLARVFQLIRNEKAEIPLHGNFFPSLIALHRILAS